MKLTNLIDNVAILNQYGYGIKTWAYVEGIDYVNKQILSVTSSVLNGLNGLLIGTMVGGIVVTLGIVDQFGIVLAQDKKKKK